MCRQEKFEKKAVRKRKGKADERRKSKKRRSFKAPFGRPSYTQEKKLETVWEKEGA